MIQDGFIYIFRDPLNNNLIKVGFSKNPFHRLRQLHNTSTPSQFLISQIWWVADMRQAENIAHNRLQDHRINPRREFFEIAPSMDFHDFERMDYDITSTYLDVLIELIEGDFQINSMNFLVVDIQKAYTAHLNGELD